MATKKIRIVLDTNWYISATINKNSRRKLYEILTNENLVVIFSKEILKEYQQVIIRDKFRRIIKAHQVTRFMDLVISKLEQVEIIADMEGSRDTNDNYLLSLSFDSKAEYLITGDEDLLVLRTTGATQIITLGDFIKDHTS